jgi:hypothetical protein
MTVDRWRWTASPAGALAKAGLRATGFYRESGIKNRQPSTANRQRIPFAISLKVFTFAAQLIFYQKQGNEQL